MEYDVGDLLESLFGGAVPVIVVTTAQPEAVEVPTPIIDPEAANADEIPDFESLPPPGDPCPRCGSLEAWENILGRRRCGVCERDILEKAIGLTIRAARLRERAQRQKPAPRIAPGCVAAGRVDILDVGDDKATACVIGP